jgi:hypothetical protein
MIYYRTVPLAIIVQLLLHRQFLVRTDFTRIPSNRLSALYAQKVISVQVLVINQHHVLLDSIVRLVIAHVPHVLRGMNVLMVSLFHRLQLVSGGNFAKYWGASAEGTIFLGGMGECSPRKFKIWIPEMTFAAFWQHILKEISGFQNINLMMHFAINHMLSIKKTTFQRKYSRWLNTFVNGIARL